MPEPTRCPTCGHPVTIPDGGRAHWSGVPQDYATQAIPPEYRPTAPDPASVAAMRELLREMEWQGYTIDAGVGLNVCLVCGGFKQRGGHHADCKLGALLGPAATEGGG